MLQIWGSKEEQERDEKVVLTTEHKSVTITGLFQTCTKM